jgi:hypothetical protein
MMRKAMCSMVVWSQYQPLAVAMIEQHVNYMANYCTFFVLHDTDPELHSALSVKALNWSLKNGVKFAEGGRKNSI